MVTTGHVGVGEIDVGARGVSWTTGNGVAAAAGGGGAATSAGLELPRPGVATGTTCTGIAVMPPPA